MSSALEHRIVLLGGGGVGKSAITVQFVNMHFIEMYDPTIEDAYRKQIVIDGSACILDILDTAGQDEYSALRDQYMRSGQCYVLVFDLTSYRSFEQLEDFVDQLCRSLDRDHLRDQAVVLVGNKCDLPCAVTESEAQQMASRLGCRYIPVSAKTRHNVDNVFEEVVRRYRKISGFDSTKSLAQINQNQNKNKKKSRKPSKCSIM